MCGCFDSWMGVLAICVLVFTVFCITSLMYIYSYLLLVQGLLPPSEKSIAVNNNNNNNNNNNMSCPKSEKHKYVNTLICL